MRERGGFSLIELLVVIGTIAVLMAIVLSGMGQTTRQARSVVCLSNLHQWSIVWKAYTDTEGSFTTGLRWHKALKQYYRNEKIRLCPAATRSYSNGGRNPFGAFELDGALYSYGMNYWLPTRPMAVGARDELMWKTPYIDEAAKVPMFLDCSLWGALPWHHDLPPEYDGQFHYENQGGNEDEMRRFCINRHYRAINGAFADFSARKTGLKELWELHWHRDWNPGNAPPPAWPEWMKDFKEYR